MHTFLVIKEAAPVQAGEPIALHAAATEQPELPDQDVRRSSYGRHLDANREGRMTAERLVAALGRALNVARPEVPGLVSVVPMTEGLLEPAAIHVVWIFHLRQHLTQTLEGGGSRLLYQLTATALREARMQTDGIDLNVHFDTQQECQEANHGNWMSRLSLLHYPARQLESQLASDRPASAADIIK